MVERKRGEGLLQRERSRIYDEFMRCRSYLGLIISRIVRGRDVEDIVQETFLRAYEASGNHQIRHPRAFLVKTARNLALNNISKMANRDEVKVDISKASSVYLETGSAEDSAELEQRLAIFCKAVQRMPKQARRAFILKKVYGLNRRDIALDMGLSESTVKKHIAKGMVVCEDYFRAVVGGDRRFPGVGAESFDSRDKRERKHG